MADAPTPGAAPDAHLIERTVGSETLLTGRFLRVQRDTVALPDGAQATREYIRHPGAVMVVPLLDDGRLLMERQWRHPLQRVLLEFPAGKLDAGEAPLDCGRRELLEETGYRATEWAHAGWMHNAPAYSDEGIDVWFARGLVAGPQHLDDGEFIETVAMSPAELDALAGRGELTDAKTLVGLLWFQRWVSGGWPLSWQQPG
ncbi:NUDIX domain-containing protein [Rubrivivax albus]|uniref:GDP-mannose pyrophosphatase n=1 Tax=Rubrivivax albus TaxID=2499835 RepID=A0A437K1W1_9BURK|nr:NUDIX hydrolase [Rubrivivax albus]MCB1995166.1 NUDIX hydrolase [Rhodoferax sp.]RVT54303.1 NUDIX hydrolase [Rubrivivax albus]